MPGTRTAPTVDGAPGAKTISIKYRDAFNDSGSKSVLVLGTATDAQIEALVAAMQAGSNASIFEVHVSESYAGADSVANAEADDVGGRVSFNDIIRMSSRHPITKDHIYLKLPSPVSGTLIGSSETVNNASTELLAITAAWTPMLMTGYVLKNASLVEESDEANEVVPI